MQIVERQVKAHQRCTLMETLEARDDDLVVNRWYVWWRKGMKITDGILWQVYRDSRDRTRSCTRAHTYSRKRAPVIYPPLVRPHCAIRGVREANKNTGIRLLPRAIVRKIDPAEKLAGWLSQINRLASRRGSLTASRKLGLVSSERTVIDSHRRYRVRKVESNRSQPRSDWSALGPSRY